MGPLTAWAAAALLTGVARTGTTAVSNANPLEAEEAPVSWPKVLVLPTVAQEAARGRPQVEPAQLRAFSDALEAAAVDTFSYRRFEVVFGQDAERALARAPERACRTAQCARTIAAGASATHGLYSRLMRTTSGGCVGVVELVELGGEEQTRREGRDIVPCSADNLLASATALGRTIASGPRAPVRVSLSLTPLSPGSIDIPDVPDPSTYMTTTSTLPRTRKAFSLERALEIYKEKHMFVFDEEGHGDAFFVARNGHLINECDVRRAASVPISPDMREFCEGNSWEWAWTAFPVGAAITALTVDDIGRGGALRFLFGVSLSAISATLALVLNVDAVDIESGRHFSDRETLESIVAHSNANLREVLDLTEAEVDVAGMRR